MKILHVDSGREWRGGQAQVLHLMVGLAARGHEQDLMAWPGGPLADRARARGFRVEGVPVRGDLDVAAILAIAGRARRTGATVIHAHTAHAHAAAMAAAKLARVRGRVVTRRVVLPVGGTPWSRAKYRDATIRYVAISEAVAEVLVRGGVDPDRIRVVYSGIPSDGVPLASDPESRRLARAGLGLPEEGTVLGVVGALTGEKGQETAVEAMAFLPADVRLVLIGDGPEREGLLRRVLRLGVQGRVHLPGFLSETRGYIPAFDLALAPSRHEGLGTAVLEAMAAGVPVVASSIGAFRRMLDEGRVGALVEPGDSRELARTVTSLMGDPDRRAAMTTAGLARVRDYSTENMVLGTENVYRDLEDLK